MVAENQRDSKKSQPVAMVAGATVNRRVDSTNLAGEPNPSALRLATYGLSPGWFGTFCENDDLAAPFSHFQSHADSIDLYAIRRQRRAQGAPGARSQRPFLNVVIVPGRRNSAD